MNRISIEVNVAGKDFTFAYDIPDVGGHIPQTDQNEKWLAEHLHAALRPVLGKLVAVDRDAPVVRVPVQPKREARAGTI